MGAAVPARQAHVGHLSAMSPPIPPIPMPAPVVPPERSCSVVRKVFAPEIIYTDGSGMVDFRQRSREGHDPVPSFAGFRHGTAPRAGAPLVRLSARKGRHKPAQGGALGPSRPPGARSPERAIQSASRVPFCRPFRACWSVVWPGLPGWCPGLVCPAPSGLRHGPVADSRMFIEAAVDVVLHHSEPLQPPETAHAALDRGPHRAIPGTPHASASPVPPRRSPSGVPDGPPARRS